MKFEKQIELFKDFIRISNFSERTLINYGLQVTKFILFLEQFYPRIDDLSKVTKKEISDYSNYLSTYKDKKGKLLSAKTQCLKLRALRKFFNFLTREDFILKDPTISITFPKLEKDLPRNVLTESEVLEVLNSIDTKTPIGKRNKAVIELFYSSGMRTSELANLKIADLDLKEQLITIVRGKGNKTRVVPIGQYATEYIKDYLEHSRKFMLKGKKVDDGFLFLSERGRPFDRSTLNKCVMAQVSKNVKINKKITCYSFRHSVATHLIKNKVDIRYVSELLGHSSLKTTQKYCHLDISDLKKMHSLYHPREKEGEQKE